MRKILVTGGTVFVSKYVAEYYVENGDEVYVLNRNHHIQPKGVILIEGDRRNLGEKLKPYNFDAVLDITAYTSEDVSCLLDALGSFKDYILISSGAVYPETLSKPFIEEQPLGKNKFWSAYGTNKVKAERELLSRTPQAYILRPPYLYGPMNNLYREAFVFECAIKNRKFYVPQNGDMKLQFFYIKDLCKVIDALLEKKPKQQIYNVGNKDTISITEWVKLCYQIVGKTPEFVQVHNDLEQRKYFCFYNYEYQLEVSKQNQLINKTIPLEAGLEEAFVWYRENANEINRKEYIEYIDKYLT